MCTGLSIAWLKLLYVDLSIKGNHVRGIQYMYYVYSLLWRCVTYTWYILEMHLDVYLFLMIVFRSECVNPILELRMKTIMADPRGPTFVLVMSMLNFKLCDIQGSNSHSNNSFHSFPDAFTVHDTQDRAGLHCWYPYRIWYLRSSDEVYRSEGTNFRSKLLKE